MRIHALCVVKNEADIIEQTLRAAVEWCDWIYVLDNGSTDGTWEKVQSLAHDLQSIIPFKQDNYPFTDSIRGDILAEYKDRAHAGDWWCILDADEFYIDNPRLFVRAVPQRFNSVWMQRYNYLFTEKDAIDYHQNPSLYADSVPIDQRLRYYVMDDYSEMRFFRHSKSLKHIPAWEQYPVFPRRIRLKHFMYRSPEQIHKRLHTRREPMQRGEFWHEKRANWVTGGIAPHGPAQTDEIPSSWRERVVPTVECHFDTADGLYPQGSSWTPPKGPTWAVRLRSRARSFLQRVWV